MARKQPTEAQLDRAEDITEAWGKTFPGHRFTGSTLDNALLRVRPQEVVDLVASVLAEHDLASAARARIAELEKKLADPQSGSTENAIVHVRIDTLRKLLEA